MEKLNEVLIADKKSRAITYKNMLHWEDYSFQVTTITDTVDLAIAYYGEYQYKLVITALDFEEKGDGLSLIKIIKSLNPSCQIIVISDRDDFPCVRQAFLNGASDFLLRKELRYQTLVDSLQRVLAFIKTEAIADHNQLTKMLGLIRDGQKVDDNAVMSYLKKEHYPMLYGEWQMVYFRMDNVRHINRRLRDYEQQEHRDDTDFIDMFQQRIKDREKLQDDLLAVIHANVFVEHEVIFTKKHSGLLIVPIMKPVMLREQCNTLKSAMVNRIHYTFSVTISLPGKGIADFLPRYREVIDYHGHKFYENDFCILNVADGNRFHPLEKMDRSFEKKIIQALNDRNQLHEVIETILDHMRENSIDPKDVKRYFVQLIKVTAHHFDEMMKIDMAQLQIYEKGVQECESVGFMRYELYRIFSAISLTVLCTEHPLDHVEAIRRYIQQNYGQKITLSMIASEIGLNESYAGRLFKKTTGMSIFQYVNDVRMEKGAELLKESDLKVREIASKVGIYDQLYFNKMFRRTFGQSPSEYRNMHGNGKTEHK